MMFKPTVQGITIKGNNTNKQTTSQDNMRSIDQSQ